MPPPPRRGATLHESWLDILNDIVGVGLLATYTDPDHEDPT